MKNQAQTEIFLVKKHSYTLRSLNLRGIRYSSKFGISGRGTSLKGRGRSPLRRGLENKVQRSGKPKSEEYSNLAIG
jgi:hypothetical protein